MEAQVDFFPKTLNIRRFLLMDTDNFFVLVGTDKTLRQQQVLTILKFDDTKQNYSLKDILIEDKRTYKEEEFANYLYELKARFNPVTPRVERAYGVLGFIRFLKGYYLILITSRKRVGKLLRHSIYTVKDMQLVPMFR